MAKREPLLIDPDLWKATKEYVESQLAIMRKYGGEPVLPEGGIDSLIRRVAQYPQRVRNLTRKLEVKAVGKGGKQ